MSNNPLHMEFQVGLKVLLRDKDKFLFLEDAIGKHYDFPGGRIDQNESRLPLEEIIDREIREELGADLKYRLKAPILQYRRYFESKGLNIFVTIYEAEYISGKIELSNEHSNYTWINPKKDQITLERYYNDEEKMAFTAYFNAL